MGLNWQWKDKIGEIEYSDNTKNNLYTGNAMVIAVGEEDNKYWLSWFVNDKRHLENMLGLNKEYERCFEHFGITKIKLDTNFKDTKTIVTLLAKAKAKMTIELY